MQKYVHGKLTTREILKNSFINEYLLFKRKQCTDVLCKFFFQKGPTKQGRYSKKSIMYKGTFSSRGNLLLGDVPWSVVECWHLSLTYLILPYSLFNVALPETKTTGCGLLRSYLTCLNSPHLLPRQLQPCLYCSFQVISCCNLCEGGGYSACERPAPPRTY